MKSLHMSILELEPLTDTIVTDSDQLRLRADLLDERLINSPSGIANATKIELIKQLQEQAPWLAPMVI